MPVNESTLDRVLRGLVVAPLAVVAAALVGFSSVVGVILLVVAVVMALTAIVGMCPLYRLLGIDTRRGAAHEGR